MEFVMGIMILCSIYIASKQLLLYFYIPYLLNSAEI